MTTAMTDYYATTGLPQRGDVLASKYRIEGVLGVGGMAVVLDATHLALQERVAIKMLLPECAEHAESVDRFMQEGRAATRIRSEHVVRVLDVDAAEGRPYLVLEYLDGLDLERLVAAGGPLPISRAVDFVLQACEALGEAHAAGVIHRDLKPANLFLCYRADGSACVKVLDFGISKIIPRGPRDSGLRTLATMPQTVMGSPHYMSPEQMRSAQNVDARSDIWSLGAVLHELLAAEPPFQADSVTALCARILGEPPRPLADTRPDVPSALAAVVLRCLEKEPLRRYANVAEFARALSGFGSSSAVASAERIGRVVEGGPGFAPSHPTSSSSLRVGGPLGISAAAMVDDLPPTPMKGGSVAYPLLGALVAIAGLVGLGSAIELRASRSAGQVPPPIGLVLPPVPASAVPAPPPPPAATPPPNAVAIEPGPAVAPALATTSARDPASLGSRGSPERHPPSRTATAPRRQVPADDALPIPEPPPRATPTALPPPSPSLESLLPSRAAPGPSATPASSNNPDELFDERK